MPYFPRKTSKRAAEFWAKAISIGKIQPKGISADIVILAHAKLKQDEFPGRQIVIATKNISDFTIFDSAYLNITVLRWQSIKF